MPKPVRPAETCRYVGLTPVADQPAAPSDPLENIRRKAAESHSDAVLVFKNGQLLLEWYPKNKPLRPIELMSCTKSIVNIVIGRLVDEGRIKSLDQSVSDFYPEWKQGKKQLITIRHLLNHTSGLQNKPDTTIEIYPCPDFVKLALCAELSSTPGSEFSYNNKAVNLLAGIVQAATGQRMDRYCSQEIFKPMGITEFEWTLDKAGNPHGMAGLKLNARDFAKFGQLILNNGLWNGTRIVSKKWIVDSMAPGQPFEATCGLLWWRVAETTTYQINDAKFKELEQANVDQTFLKNIAPLKDEVFKSFADYNKALIDVLGENYGDELMQKMPHNMRLSRKTYGNFVAYAAVGYLGQYLYVFPKTNVVAVRQIESSDSYNEKTDGFDDFFDAVKPLSQ